MDVSETSAASSASAVAAPTSKRKNGATRSACDRCHSQKLRCVKNTNQQSCDRCSRLHTTCQFSPRVPRPSQKARDEGEVCNYTGMRNTCRTPIGYEAGKGSISNPFLEQIEICTPGFRHLIEDGSLVRQNFDWSGIFSQSSDLGLIDNDISSELAVVLPPVDQNTSNEVNEIFNTYPRAHAEGHSSLVRKAADLHVALQTCVANLPTIVDSNRQRAMLLVFEEVFTLTDTFLNILRNFSFRGSDGQFNHLANFSTVDLERHKPFLHIDEGTLLLLASCNSHLVNIFDSVFQRIQGCLKHSLRPHPSTDWAVVLPKLQIGTVEIPSVRIDANTSFPPPATTAMYMLMVTMLSSQLWEQLTGVVGNTVNDLGSSVTLKDIVWNAVIDRTAGTLKIINDTKLLLQQQSS